MILFATGTSLALIFEAKQEGLLGGSCNTWDASKEKFPQAKTVSGEIAKSGNHKYRGIASPDRTIRSLVSSFNEFVVVTNSDGTAYPSGEGV